MKKVLSLVALAMISTIMFAVNDGVKADQNKKEAKSGEVIVMNKEMFINDVFDYQNSKEWKYKGDKPAIIDLYADWCGPCRMTAPIMKSLAKEYDGKIVIYKVNVDKEKEESGCHSNRSGTNRDYSQRVAKIGRIDRYLGKQIA